MSNNDFRLEDFNSNNDIKSEVVTKIIFLECILMIMKSL